MEPSRALRPWCSEKPEFTAYLGPAILVLATLYPVSCAHSETAKRETARILLAMEQAALDRWGMGDPGGYLEIFGPEITYFNPFLNRRIDGLGEMSDYYQSLAGEASIDRFEIVDPTVQLHGRIAVLSYHLYNYRTLPDGGEEEDSRWNSTKVYARVDGDWRIIHNHWAFLRPELTEDSRGRE